MKRIIWLLIILVSTFSVEAQYILGAFNPNGMNETPFADIKTNHFEKQNPWKMKNGYAVSIGFVYNNNSSSKMAGFEEKTENVSNITSMIPEFCLSYKSDQQIIEILYENKKQVKLNGIFDIYSTQYPYLTRNKAQISYNNNILSLSYGYLVNDRLFINAGVLLNKYTFKVDREANGETTSESSKWFDGLQFKIGAEVNYFENNRMYITYNSIKKEVGTEYSKLNYHHYLSYGLNFIITEKYEVYTGLNHYYQPYPEEFEYGYNGGSGYYYGSRKNEETFPQNEFFLGTKIQIFNWLYLTGSYYQYFSSKYWATLFHESGGVSFQAVEYKKVDSNKFGIEAIFQNYDISLNYQSSDSQIIIFNDYSNYVDSHFFTGKISYQF